MDTTLTTQPVAEKNRQPRREARHQQAAPQAVPGHPLLQLQRAAGNQAVGQSLRLHMPAALPDVSALSRTEPTSPAEHQARRAASQVGRQDSKPRAENRESPIAPPSPAARASLPAGLSQEGQPLPPAAARDFGSQLGTDLSHVRLHTGEQAAFLSKVLHANAFTHGSDIYFARGRYQPATSAGRGLLAHELVHTAQQATGPGQQGQFAAVQRDEASGPAPSGITARAIFPFPQGARLVLNRILPENWFSMLSSLQPQVGTALTTIESKVATVTSATDDLFEATIQEQIQIPGGKNQPAQTLQNLVLRLRRSADGAFDLELVGQTGKDTPAVELFAQRGLQASRQGGQVFLSSGQTRHFGITPGEGGKNVKLQAFTAPYLSEIPESLRGLAPEKLDFIQLTRLPDAPKGSAEERAAIEQTARSVSSRRSVPRQSFSAGGGFLAGGGLGISPLFSAAWQLNLRPVEKAGTLFQVPINVQLQYAPQSSFLGSATSGAEFSLSQLNIPVNVRILAGVGGGTVQGPEQGGERPRFGVVGPTAGAGLGYETRYFRLDLRYDYLRNLVENAPSNIHTTSLQAGLRF